MRNNVRIFFLGLALTLCVGAQALTDSQVTQKALQLYKQGNNETQIAQKLMTQGATMDQLKRLSETQGLKGLKSESNTKASSSTNQTEKNYTRTNNGEKSINSKTGLLTTKGEKTATESDIFGHNIFRTTNSEIEPQMNQATPKNYVLGAGDEVIIDVFGSSQMQWALEITPDGNITIEEYGPILLGGLTIQEATRRLKNTLGQRYQNCQISLSLGQSRSITVQVMGEVEIPGSYTLSAFATPLNALFVAGGVGEMGTLRSIKVYRASKLVNTVDLYRYLLDGEQAANQRLEDGDVILVGAYDQMVQIRGNIKRPMYYEMAKGETMDKLIYYAGGFAGDAYTDAVRLSRRNGEESVLTVRNASFDQCALMDGDSISVEAITPRLVNTVTIEGGVFRPGQYGLSENMKTVKQLVEMAGGPIEQAFTKRAVLYRMNLNRTLQAAAFNLEEILSGAVPDIELRNEDQVFVPSKEKQLEEQHVIIHGEVYEPGTYTYAENETVEDLILRAGGLTDKASTRKVDISRRIINPNAEKESSIESEIYTISISEDLIAQSSNFTLQPFDEVYIRQSPAYNPQRNVQVRGEVLFDGTYALRTKEDRLSDLIKNAGGLNERAFASGARLLRIMNEEEKIRRDQLLKMNEGASEMENVDSAKLNIDDMYYVGIDLEAALHNPGGNEDIILREGDVLIVPSFNTTVRINGEVCFPNTVSYIPGKRGRYYINQAGGFSHLARRNQAYIIYPGGKVMPMCGHKIQPGCEIVVPGRPERQPMTVSQWVSIASASASLASVAATITTLVINTTKK